MTIKTITIFAFAALPVMFSCHPNSKKSPVSSAPKVVAAHGYEVPIESMAEPKVVPAGKAKVVRVGNPTVILTNTNVHPAGTPRMVIAGVPRVSTPGRDGFSLPKTVMGIDSPFIAGIPKIVIAKEAFTKEQNPQNFSSFGILEGLINNEVLCMLEDKSGNLWIGTENGVSKYDGKNFTHFTAKEGLANNIVNTICQDKSGNLWFGTSTVGVGKYDGKSFTHFTTEEGLVHNWVVSILADTRGNIWFGTNGGGVSRYDGRKFTHFTVEEGLADNHVNSICQDRSGNLWFGTNGGASRYNGTSFTHFTVKEGLSSNGVLSIEEDQKGNLWFGTRDGGVNEFDGRRFAQYTYKEGLSSNGVFSIREDKNGNLWFGTWGGGVNKFDGRTFTHFTEKEGLSNNEVRSIVEDKRGNLWFGTYGGGVNKYGGKMFTHFTVKEGLSDNRVVSILEDKSGNLWFSTYGGGVSRYDGRSFSNFTSDGFRLVWNMLEDKKGNLWFGSFWGIGKYDGQNFTHFAEKSIDVKCMMEDKTGNLWLGTHMEGVSKFDGKNFTDFTKKEGLSKNQVRSIAEDENGNIWFGTEGGGLSRLDPDGKRFTHFTEKGGLNDNKIVRIHKDKSGNLWFGSWGGGLSKYDHKYFTHFKEKEGLSNLNVRSIMEDRSGNLWFGTASGFCKLEKDKLASTSKPAAPGSFREGTANPGLFFKTYNYEDGFSGIEVTWGNTICEARDGTIWIAARDRLTAFHPGEDIPDTIPPNMQLTGLTLFNESIAWQDLEKKSDTSIVLGNGVSLQDFHFDGTSKWYGLPEHLSLAHDNNYLTFQFVGITTQSPKKVKYQYKLEGLDKNWSALTSRSDAPYGNLPHGNYTFKAKAMNVDGYWSSELNYSFTIRPPWWYTWWAYTLFALSFAAIIYALFRYRLNKIRTKQKASELEMQALRAQMNPHFIFNSLNSINMFILENHKLQASEYLSKFSRLVRLILQNSRQAFIPLEKELEALELYLELESLRFEHKFEYKIAVDDEVDSSLLKVPPLMIQPYAENAIWHGLMHKTERGVLEIELYQRDKMLFCRITDNGIGRKKAAELKSRSSITHQSMGMRITADRIRMLQQQNEQNASISINDLILPDGDPGGTEVLIKIPLLYD